MSKNEEYQTNLPAISGDGFDDGDDDVGGGSIIKGTKLKFSKEGEWVTGGGQAVRATREFVAVEILRVVQKWSVGATTPETRILAPGEKPDVDALNASVPEEWTEKFGKMVGPYEYALVVYLIDAVTLAPHTFVTSTAGGGQAVRDLREATRLARRLRGSNVFPRLRLADEHMRTAYGGRQRPSFDIVGYEVLGGGDNTTLAPAAPKQIEHTEPELKPEPKPEKRKVRI